MRKPKVGEKRIYFALPLLLLAAVLAAQFSSAVVIGANRGVLNFNNVLQNGYAQELVTFTTDTDFNVSVTGTVKGDIADWVRFDPPEKTFYISKDNPFTLAVIVEPPGDTKIDKYTGSIEFLTGALAAPGGQFGTSVRTAITVNMGVQVTGQELVSCQIAGLSMEDVEEGYPIEVSGVVINNGNVRIKPEIDMEFWNQDQTKLVQTFSFTPDEQTLPTTQKRFFKSLSQKLPIGQYWVKTSAPLCGEGSAGFYTLSVFERGGVSDKGELVKIDNPLDAEVGQIIPIDAVFTNLGSRVVSAKFKGTIVSGDRDNIFKVIDTEPIDVDPGQTERLRTYFNPVQEGQYLVVGQVLYNRKLTFEKSSVINVYPVGGIAKKKSLNRSILLLALIAAAIVVVVLIIRKRKSQGRRHRHGPW